MFLLIENIQTKEKYYFAYKNKNNFHFWPLKDKSIKKSMHLII